MPAVVTEAREDLVLDFFSFLDCCSCALHLEYPGDPSEVQRLASHMCNSSPWSPLHVEKWSTHSCLLGKLSPFSLSGIFCIFQYFLLASLEMTSVRKLVSRGAKDSKTGIGELQCHWLQFLVNSSTAGIRFALCKVLNPKVLPDLCQRKVTGISNAR